MNSLTDLRERASKGIVLLLWVNLALIVARAVWGTEASLVVLVGGGLVVTLAATASWLTDRTGPTRRTVTGLASIGSGYRLKPAAIRPRGAPGRYQPAGAPPR